MSDKVIRLGADVSGALAGIKKVNESVGQLRTGVESISRSSALASSAITRLSGVLAGAFSANRFMSLIALLDDMKDRADAIGISLERFQRLRLAGLMGGVGRPEDILARGQEFLTRFREGDKQAQEIGRQIGIGFASTVEDLITASAGTMYTRTIFGRGALGVDITSMLHQDQITGVIPNRVAESADRLNDAFDLLKNTIIIELSPIIESFTNGLRFIIENFKIFMSTLVAGGVGYLGVRKYSEVGSHFWGGYFTRIKLLEASLNNRFIRWINQSLSASVDIRWLLPFTGKIGSVVKKIGNNVRQWLTYMESSMSLLHADLKAFAAAWGRAFGFIGGALLFSGYVLVSGMNKYSRGWNNFWSSISRTLEKAYSNLVVSTNMLQDRVNDVLVRTGADKIVNLVDTVLFGSLRKLYSTVAGSVKLLGHSVDVVSEAFGGGSLFFNMEGENGPAVRNRRYVLNALEEKMKGFADNTKSLLDNIGMMVESFPSLPQSTVASPIQIMDEVNRNRNKLNEMRTVLENYIKSLEQSSPILQPLVELLEQLNAVMKKAGDGIKNVKNRYTDTFRAFIGQLGIVMPSDNTVDFIESFQRIRNELNLALNKGLLSAEEYTALVQDVSSGITENLRNTLRNSGLNVESFTDQYQGIQRSYEQAAEVIRSMADNGLISIQTMNEYFASLNQSFQKQSNALRERFGLPTITSFTDYMSQMYDQLKRIGETARRVIEDLNPFERIKQQIAPAVEAFKYGFIDLFQLEAWSIKNFADDLNQQYQRNRAGFLVGQAGISSYFQQTAQPLSSISNGVMAIRELLRYMVNEGVTVRI